MKMPRGFTLIELVVVILILTVLAAIVIPNVVGRTAEAKRDKAVSDIASIGAALQGFRADVGRFPTATEGLPALATAPANVKNWQGPYMAHIPTDPWDHPYVYENPNPDPSLTGTPNGPSTYKLTSYGADGAPGGQGDAADITDETEQ